MSHFFKPLKNKNIVRDEARFQILRLLHDNPSLTQRELGGRLVISLGAVNYCLRALIEPNLVKAGNFQRHPDKLGCAYLFTPAGIAERALLTHRFLFRKIDEYEALTLEIAMLEREAGSDLNSWLPSVPQEIF